MRRRPPSATTPASSAARRLRPPAKYPPTSARLDDDERGLADPVRPGGRGRPRRPATSPAGTTRPTFEVETEGRRQPGHGRRPAGRAAHPRRWSTQHFPDDGFLGEEFGDQPGTTGFRWVIDPIDGTKSFIRHIPIWGTLVGLEYQGEQIAGVAYVPVLGQTYRALRGDGAYLDDRRIRVSDVDEARRRLLCYSSVNWFTKAGRERAFLDLVRPDRTGSAGSATSTASCSSPRGRATSWSTTASTPGTWPRLKPIVEEAGGAFTDWDGTPDHRPPRRARQQRQAARNGLGGTGEVTSGRAEAVSANRGLTPPARITPLSPPSRTPRSSRPASPCRRRGSGSRCAAARRPPRTHARTAASTCSRRAGPQHLLVDVPLEDQVRVVAPGRREVVPAAEADHFRPGRAPSGRGTGTPSRTGCAARPSPPARMRGVVRLRPAVVLVAGRASRPTSRRAGTRPPRRRSACCRKPTGRAGEAFEQAVPHLRVARRRSGGSRPRPCRCRCSTSPP